MDRISPTQIRHIYLMLIWSAAATTISMFLHTLKFKKYIGPKTSVRASDAIAFLFLCVNSVCCCCVSTCTIWRPILPLSIRGCASPKCFLYRGTSVSLPWLVWPSTSVRRSLSSSTSCCWRECSTATGWDCSRRMCLKQYLLLKSRLP